MAGIELTWTTEPPTKPGVYWFQPETMPRALTVDVHVRDGQLTCFSYGTVTPFT